MLFSNVSILSKKSLTPISFNISKGPLDQLNPSLIASSISLNLSVIPGTKDDAYLIIFEITDQAYSPYLSFLFIRPTISIFSDPKLNFLDSEYSPVSKFIPSRIFLLSDLFIL